MSSSLTEDLASLQDSWLEDRLKDAKNAKYTFIFQHIPWFLQTPEEEKEYFNIEETLRKKMLDKW